MGFVDDIRRVVVESMVYVCPIIDGGDKLSIIKANVVDPGAAERGLERGWDVLLSENPEELAQFGVTLCNVSALRQPLGLALRNRFNNYSTLETTE